MNAYDNRTSACIDFVKKATARIRYIQTWLEKEEKTFKEFLLPLQNSRVGNLNPVQLYGYKEQVKLAQPQLITYAPMLIKVLQQLSMFKNFLNLIESHFNNQGIAKFHKIFQIDIPQSVNEINELDDRINRIYQIVKMLENFHHELQQLLD